MPNTDAALYICPEATANTEEVPAVGEAVHFKKFSFDIAGSGPQKRDIVLPVADCLPDRVPVDFYAQGEIVTEIKLGASAATDVPELGPAFVMAGFKETIGASSVTYGVDDAPNLSTRALATGTIVLQEQPAGDGNQFVSIGSRIGGFKISGTHDKAPEIALPFMGRWKAPADLAAPTAGTYNAGLPAAKIKTGGASVTVHSYNPVLRSWSIDAGMELVPRGSTKDQVTGGYAFPCWLGRSKPAFGQLEFEQTDQSEFAFWSKVMAGTEGVIEFTFTTGSRSLAITMNQTTFGFPKRNAQMGQPTLITVPFAAGAGAAASLVLVFN